MTLMPVTRMAASVDWSTNSGASAWIGADMSLPMGPRSSIGSPLTFLIRPGGFGGAGGGQFAADGPALVDRLADDVHDPAEGFGADGDADLRAGGVDRLAAGQAIGRVHGDGADHVLAEVLRDFEDQPVAAIVGLERGQDRRKLTLKRHVD